MSAQFVNLLFTFRDPNLPENDGISPHDRGTSTYFSDEKWPKYNTSHQQYLHIGRYIYLIQEKM